MAKAFAFFILSVALAAVTAQAVTSQTVEWFEPKISDDLGDEVILSLRGRACFNCELNVTIPYFYYIPEEGAIKKVLLKDQYKNMLVTTNGEGTFEVSFKTPKVRVQIPVVMTLPSGEIKNQALNFNSKNARAEYPAIALGIAAGIKKMRKYKSEHMLSTGPFSETYKVTVQSPNQFANFSLINPFSLQYRYFSAKIDGDINVSQYQFSQANELKARTADANYIRGAVGWKQALQDSNKYVGAYLYYNDIPVAYPYSAIDIEVKKESAIQVGGRYTGRMPGVQGMDFEYFLGAMTPLFGSSVKMAQSFSMEAGFNWFFAHSDNAEYGVTLRGMVENYKIKYTSLNNQVSSTADVSNTFITGHFVMRFGTLDSN